MNTEKNTSVKKYIVLAMTAIFAIGLLSACGGSEEESSSDTVETTKATVTAGEAAENEALEKAENSSKQKKTGTEDGAIDAVQKAAYEDIKGYDGKWQNLSVDVDDPITTIEFDWNNTHYKYEYDQDARSLLKQFVTHANGRR